nr:ribonuclease H-like domain-containing protein [Tanacetum cinerariifolium]
PTPSIDASKCNTSELQSSDFSISEHGESSGGKITGKGIIKIGKVEFKNVYFVKELKYNLFSVSQICDNKNSVLFTDSECIVLGKDIKLKDDTNVLLRTPKQHNMYSIDLNNIFPHKNLTCLVAKASVDESMLWHRRLGHLNFKTMNKLVRHNLVKGLPSKCFENDHTCVACLKGKKHKASCKTKCDNGGEFKNKEMNEFCTKKGIRREFSNAKTPQQNRVAKRRNRTLIEVARTMLADAKLSVPFWAEEVNSACYVQNRVLVNKSHNKTPYELFNYRTPSIGFLRPFGCHVMILNTLDHLGKFDAKGDEGYFVGYSLSSKAFRVFNKRTKKVEENLHVDFLENKLIKKDAGLNWLFDIDTLTNFMNYVPVVVAGTSSTNISGTKDVASQDVKKEVSSLRYIALPNWFLEAHMETRNNDAPDICNADDPESSGISNPTATLKVPSADQVEPAVSLTMESETPVPTVCLYISPESSSGPRLISKGDFSQKETPSLGNA